MAVQPSLHRLEQLEPAREPSRSANLGGESKGHAAATHPTHRPADRDPITHSYEKYEQFGWATQRTWHCTSLDSTGFMIAGAESQPGTSYSWLS